MPHRDPPQAPCFSRPGPFLLDRHHRHIRVSAPTRRDCGHSGPGLGITHVTWRVERVMPERVISQRRLAAAPIRTCWPANVKGWGLLLSGPTISTCLLAPSPGGAFSLLDLLWRATCAPYLTSLRATFAPHHTSLPATLAPRLTPLRATHASLLTPLRAGLRTSCWGSGRGSLRRLRASGRGSGLRLSI